ncbi:MAG: sigma factor-like helix-turn-helix DNA-binding protein [Eubacteriales bacterium]|nr:sigma factor-like helix-turn-helix DNA-binding protein [Eubacteriales bacterium]
MQTINLKKYYYPLYRTDTYITVPDEVAEALLLMLREENNYARKIWYHKAFFSLDCEDGIENSAIGWAQPSPEDHLVEREEQAEREEWIRRLYEALSTLTPIQARRVHARYMLGMKIKEVAEMEGITPSQAGKSIRSGLRRMRRYFDRQKWTYGL